MKRLTVLTAVLWITSVRASHAEWGWPPPGYSVTGVRACDGYQYRGLRQVLRDRRCRSGGCASRIPEPANTSVSGAPAASVAPKLEDSSLPLPAPSAK